MSDIDKESRINVFIFSLILGNLIRLGFPDCKASKQEIWQLALNSWNLKSFVELSTSNLIKEDGAARTKSGFGSSEQNKFFFFFIFLLKVLLSNETAISKPN